jgi:hypothetical protein
VANSSKKLSEFKTPMFNRYSPQEQKLGEQLDKEPLPKINAVFEEESKDESSSHKSNGIDDEDKEEV